MIFSQVYYRQKIIDQPYERYIDGRIEFNYDFKRDLVSHFEIESIVQYFGYIREDRLYYLFPYKPNQTSVRSRDDNNYVEMLACHEG